MLATIKSFEEQDSIFAFSQSIEREFNPVFLLGTSLIAAQRDENVIKATDFDDVDGDPDKSFYADVGQLSWNVNKSNHNMREEDKCVLFTTVPASQWIDGGCDVLICFALCHKTIVPTNASTEEPTVSPASPTISLTMAPALSVSIAAKAPSNTEATETTNPEDSLLTKVEFEVGSSILLSDFTVAALLHIKFRKPLNKIIAAQNEHL